MEAENAIPLEGLAAGVDYLEAIVVFLIAPAMTYASWVRPSTPLSAGAMGRAYAEALGACANAACRIESATPAATPIGRPVSLTIEDERHTAIVQQVRAFGVAIVFERQAPLGLARAHSHKIVRTLEHELPYGDVSGIRVQPPAPVTVIAPSPSMAPTVSVPALVQRSDGAAIVPPPLQTQQAEGEVEERAPDTSDSRPGSRGPDAQRFARPVEVDEPPMSGAHPEKPAIVIPVAVGAGTVADGMQRAPTWASEPPRAMPAPPAMVSSAPSSAPSSAGGESTRARALGIVRYVEAASPEPHIAVLRLALRSGLGLDRMRDLGALTTEQLMLLESAAEEMFGLERGQVQKRVEEKLGSSSADVVAREGGA